MAQVLIRNLDQSVVADLKRKAEAAGLSLEAFLRETLIRTTEPGRAELVAQIDSLRRTLKPPRPDEPLSDALIRQSREERMRGLEE